MTANPLKHSGYYIYHFNIKKHWNLASVFVRYCIIVFVIISLNSINQCVFVTTKSCLLRGRNLIVYILFR
jgi:hypothetical protein